MKAITDTECLDWLIRNPYKVRELYAWFGNQDVAKFRELIDNEIRTETKAEG